MAATSILKLRLLRDSPLPPGASGDEAPCAFGLQDNKGQLHDLLPLADGKLAIEFELRVAAVADETQPPLFLGPFAFGTPQDRFVYLSWQRPDTPGYVNRVKARLADIDWAMVHAVQESGGRLEADLSGRKAGGGKLPVSWRLVEA
ncbi:MAG: hypothetical protein ABS86_06305 [Sphingobium sp. SCN 64-10]|nr:MAG: hypothetical protein ABS86_06305 [Sphingobium sp. SCN 64-10]